MPKTSALRVQGIRLAQDFYTQVDAAKAAKGFSGSSETSSSLAGAVKNGKRTVVLVGAGLLGLLILYVMWPSGSSYGYDGVEETEHFISVSGTQVRLPSLLSLSQPCWQHHKQLPIHLMWSDMQWSCKAGGHCHAPARLQEKGKWCPCAAV